jgi:hypothetical protein
METLFCNDIIAYIHSFDAEHRHKYMACMVELQAQILGSINFCEGLIELPGHPYTGSAELYSNNEIQGVPGIYKLTFHCYDEEDEEDFDYNSRRDCWSIYTILILSADESVIEWNEPKKLKRCLEEYLSYLKINMTPPSNLFFRDVYEGAHRYSRCYQDAVDEIECWIYKTPPYITLHNDSLSNAFLQVLAELESTVDTCPPSFVSYGYKPNAYEGPGWNCTCDCCVGFPISHYPHRVKSVLENSKDDCEWNQPRHYYWHENFVSNHQPIIDDDDDDDDEYDPEDLLADL